MSKLTKRDIPLMDRGKDGHYRKALLYKIMYIHIYRWFENVKFQSKSFETLIPDLHFILKDDKIHSVYFDFIFC